MGTFGNTFGNLVQNRAVLNQPLSALTAQMDMWSNTINADGLTLSGSVGTGGVLKGFPCLSMTKENSDEIYGADNSFLMLDQTAIYEHYLETIFESFPTNLRGDVITSYLVSGNNGFLFYSYNTGYFLNVKNGTTQESLDKRSAGVFVVGLNKIKLTFNLPTKTATININGTSFDYTWALTGVLDVAGQRLQIGNGSNSRTQKPIYYRMSKNGVPIKEFVLGDIYKPKYQAYYIIHDLIGSVPMALSSTTLITKTTQDLANPYKYGYDLYWIDDTMKYQAVSPVNSLGTSKNPSTWGNGTYDSFQLFKRVLATEIGYHIVNYVQMPNLSIFDTTNRTYWKAAITSDPYYVGATAGKERYFHKTWFDFDWIEAHIETAYKGLFYVVSNQQKATGQYNIKTKLNDIVLFKAAVTGYDKRNDKYATIDLGHFYETFLMRADNQEFYELKHSLGNKMVARKGNFLMYSTDAGHTYSAGVDFSSLFTYAKLQQVRITEMGNIVVFTNQKVFYSTDNLVTLVECTLKNADGSPLTIQIPVNPTYPLIYFGSLNTFCDDGILLYGNYTGMTAGPVHMYYSIDDGLTWKVYYTYGQNPGRTDVGAVEAGVGGTPVGNASNTLITDHVHAITKGSDGNYYVFTGDNNNTMMKCVYNSGTDTWTVTNLLDVTAQACPRMRSIGGYEINGNMIWGADTQGTFVVGGNTLQGVGIWKSAIADLNDPTKHTLKSYPNHYYQCEAFIAGTNGKMLAGFKYEVHLSNDYGETWEIFDNITDSNLIPCTFNATDEIWNGVGELKIQYLK